MRLTSTLLHFRQKSSSEIETRNVGQGGQDFEDDSKYDFNFKFEIKFDRKID